MLKLKRKPTNLNLRRPKLKLKQQRRLRREQISRLNNKSRNSREQKMIRKSKLKTRIKPIKSLNKSF